MQVSEADRRLVIELNQDDRALNPVVIDRIVLRSADPGEVGAIQTSATVIVHSKDRRLSLLGVERRQKANG